MQNLENGSGSNTILDYRKVDTEVRARAKQVKLEYTARVPQADFW